MSSGDPHFIYGFDTLLVTRIEATPVTAWLRDPETGVQAPVHAVLLALGGVLGPEGVEREHRVLLGADYVVEARIGGRLEETARAALAMPDPPDPPAMPEWSPN